jgi:hypothetical protein
LIPEKIQSNSACTANQQTDQNQFERVALEKRINWSARAYDNKCNQNEHVKRNQRKPGAFEQK